MLKHLLVILIFVLFLFTGFKRECAAQHNRFLLPLKGVQGKDYWISSYVDHDSTKAFKDGMCGDKTYDGHNGTDFSIRDFKVMDSGVNVLAIADGVVFEAIDGLYDRRKRWEEGAAGNYIAIIHDKYIVYYWHIRKNSIPVKQGDSVKAGQTIGLVGSSGYSSGPHLHIEIKENGKIIDPFSGRCNDDIDSFWKNHPIYDTSLQIVDKGFVPYVPNEDTLKERFLVTDTFRVNKDTVVCFWIQTHGLRPRNHAYVEWIKPNGKLWYKHKHTWDTHWWFNYGWFYIPVPNIIGTWTAKYYVNDKMITSKKFWVTK